MIQDIEFKFELLKDFIRSSLPPDFNFSRIIDELESFGLKLSESNSLIRLELGKYKEFFDNAGDYIFILSEGGIILSVNKSACDKYQRTYHEFIGTSVAAIDASGNVDEIMQNVNELLQSGMTRFEAIHKSRSGELFNVDVIAHRIIWEGKTAYFTVCRNITHLRQLQKALNESETKLKKIIDQISDGIIISEKNGNILIWNTGAERLTGIERSKALGKKIIELYSKVQQSKNKNKEPTNKFIQEIINSKDNNLSNQYYEYDIFIEGHGIKTVQAIFFPIVLEDGNRLFGAVVRDITKMKKIENQLRESNVAKDKIFSVIGHDLRTPFNSIIGFTDLLLANYESFERNKIKQILQYINLSAKPTLDVLTNLLEWVNVQSGQYGSNVEVCQLKSVVQEVFEIMTPAASMKDISLIESVSEKVILYADKRMLKSVLQNLITNAIKFSHSKGKVEISARKKQDFIEIEVADEGIGIDDDRKDSLFKIDSHISTLGTSGEKGSGLGLVLCKEFVTRLGGKIRVKSQKGKGSSFFITIPSFGIENNTMSNHQIQT